MSASAANRKSALPGFLRRLFGKGDSASNSLAGAANRAATERNPASVAAVASVDPNGKFLHLPLRAILAALPLELRSKVKKAPIADVTIPVLQSKVLGQISSGAVRMSFGDIRNAAPAVFLGGGDADQVQVTLPLGEILSRLNPALLARKPTQRHVEVAREVTSPFDDPSQALVFSMGKANVAEVAVPVAQAASNLPPSPLSFKPITRQPALAPTELPPSPPAQPVALPPPAARGSRPLVVRMTHPPKNAASGNVILVPLASLAETWPHELQEDIVESGLGDSKAALPCELIEISLKRGRVVFPWKVVRSWIRPTLPAQPSPFDALELELPLRVVAPLFLQRRAGSERVQQRADIDESIPNLFFGFPKPDTAPAAAASDTNYYVWSDTNDTVQADVEPAPRRRSATGTEFMVKYATPNEIVARAAALDGVAGAVIALPDGLMVASHIPPEHNGETLAAFLPQIFARLSQSTKELRMGDLNNISFTVGNVPWKIYRVNAIFFAAFGSEGKSLPTGPLAGLAGELDRKQK